MDGQGPQRAIAALLSFSLATGCLPVGALALEEGADVAVAEKASAEVSEPAIEEVAQPVEPQVEPEPVAEVEQASEVDAEPAEALPEPAVAPEPASEEPAEAEANAVTSGEGASADGEKAETSAAPQKEADSQAVQSPLAQVARLVIQDKEDASKPEAVDVTKLKVGDTLWAHAFDKDGKLVKLDGKKVTYRWLAADKPSTDPKAFVEVIGTKESLKLTPELAGRYVIVEVSEGTAKVCGPFSIPKKGETAQLEALLLPSAPKQAEAAPAASEGPASEAPALSAQAVTTAKTPTSNLDEAWSVDAAPAAVSSGAVAAVSEPVAVDGKLVVFSGADALVLSPSTGKVLEHHKNALPTAVATPCAPLLYQEVIFVPLGDGSVVALDASDSSKTSFLSKRWTSKSLVDGGAIGCSLSMAERSGKTYLVVGLSSGAATGALATLDAVTGEQVVSSQSSVAGYGVSGSLVREDVAYVGDSSGVLHAVSLRTGEDVSYLALSSSAICGKVVACGEALLVADRSGVIHKVAVDADGALVETASVRVGNGCASSPVVVGQIAVCGVCGQEGREASEAALVIVDVNQMRVGKRVTTADGVPLAKGGVTAEPLVSVGARGTWCYFAVDGPMGAVYAYRVGDAQATELFVPAGNKADRCDHPLVADADGSIYYLNASGTLAKLVAAAQGVPVLPPVPAKTQPAVPRPTASQPETPSEQGTVRPEGSATQHNVQGSAGAPQHASSAQAAQAHSGQGGRAAELMARQSQMQQMLLQDLAARNYGRMSIPGGTGGPGVEGPSALEGPMGAPEGAAESAHAPHGGPATIADADTPLAANNGPAGEIAQVNAQAVAAVSRNDGPVGIISTLAVGLLALLAYVTLRRHERPQQH